MNYIATLQCPNCGKIKQLNIAGEDFKIGFGLSGKNKETICSVCGHTYKNIDNCINMDMDRANSSEKVNGLENISTEELQKELERRFAVFSTEEIEGELQKRRTS